MAGSDEGPNALSDKAIIGVGCTAVVTSSRPRLGLHRCFVCTQTRDGLAHYQLYLSKGRRDRCGAQRCSFFCRNRAEGSWAYGLGYMPLYVCFVAILLGWRGLLYPGLTTCSCFSCVYRSLSCSSQCAAAFDSPRACSKQEAIHRPCVHILFS